MGFNIVWLGFENATKEEVSSLLSARDTGRDDPYNESPVSAGELPSGWTILFANDVTRLSEERLKRLSEDKDLIVCAVFEGPMVSQAIRYRKGEVAWSVTHISENGIYDLKVNGEPPEAFETIKARLFADQKAEENDGAAVDFVFDIPIELAKHLTGYRYDQLEFEWGKLSFTELEFEEA